MFVMIGTLPSENTGTDQRNFEPDTAYKRSAENTSRRSISEVHVFHVTTVRYTSKNEALKKEYERLIRIDVEAAIKSTRM